LHFGFHNGAQNPSTATGRRLKLRFRRGKFASLLLVLKSGRLVGAIAKRLVRRVPAPAETDSGAPSEAIHLTLHVDELYFPLDAQRAIISHNDLG
jgi:hypothetical protein